MELGPPPLLMPIGLDFDYQGPLNLGLGMPPLGPAGGMQPLEGFLSQPVRFDADGTPQFDLPGAGPPPAMPLDMTPGGLCIGMLPLGADLPPGLPPGFPLMDLPPGLPPGFSPGFMPPAAPSEGPGRPDFVGLQGGPIGPPPSEPPPARAAAVTGSTEPSMPTMDEMRKRRRGGVEGLASNKSIKHGGSVTVYNGYDVVTAKPSAGQAPKVAAAPAPAVSSSSASSSTFGVVQGIQALPRQLPEGWEMKKSRSTGKTYYVNEKLGKSQFDPPAGSSLQPAPQKKKQKASLRAKDRPDAQVTDKNGVMGVVRATDQNTNRWAKWQKCSRIVNTEPENDS